MARRKRAMISVFFFIEFLPHEFYDVAQIECKSDGDDMENPPARLIPHEVFQHVTSI